MVNNPNLRHIDVGCEYRYRSTCSLTSRSLKIIADNCPQLTHIGIVDHWHTLENDDILQFVSKCTKLKSANLKGTKIEDSVLARLARLQDLETLNLSDCVEFTKQGIESFLDEVAQGKLKRLEVINCDFLNVMRWNGLNPEKLKEDYPHVNIICDSDREDSEWDESENEEDEDEDEEDEEGDGGEYEDENDDDLCGDSCSDCDDNDEDGDEEESDEDEDE